MKYCGFHFSDEDKASNKNLLSTAKTPSQSHPPSITATTPNNKQQCKQTITVWSRRQNNDGKETDDERNNNNSLVIIKGVCYDWLLPGSVGGLHTHETDPRSLFLHLMLGWQTIQASRVLERGKKNRKSGIKREIEQDNWLGFWVGFARLVGYNEGLAGKRRMGRHVIGVVGRGNARCLRESWRALHVPLKRKEYLVG